MPGINSNYVAAPKFKKAKLTDSGTGTSLIITGLGNNLQLNSLQVTNLGITNANGVITISAKGIKDVLDGVVAAVGLVDPEGPSLQAQIGTLAEGAPSLQSQINSILDFPTDSLDSIQDIVSNYSTAISTNRSALKTELQDELSEKQFVLKGVKVNVADGTGLARDAAVAVEPVINLRFARQADLAVLEIPEFTVALGAAGDLAGCTDLLMNLRLASYDELGPDAQGNASTITTYPFSTLLAKNPTFLPAARSAGSKAGIPFPCYLYEKDAAGGEGEEFTRTGIMYLTRFEEKTGGTVESPTYSTSLVVHITREDAAFVAETSVVFPRQFFTYRTTAMVAAS